MRRVWTAAGVLGAVAVSACGHSVTPTEDFKTPQQMPVPEQVFAFASGPGINVSWFSEDVIFRIIDGWYIYRARGSAPPPGEDYTRLNSEPFLDQMFIDSDVSNGVRYWYRLTSVSPAGVESLPSNPASAQVDFDPPAPPRGLQVSLAGNFVRLDWEANPEPDLDHYNVFRTPPDNPLVFGPVPPSLPMYLDDQLQPGLTYSYWVTAVDVALNESAPSDTVSITVPSP